MRRTASGWSITEVLTLVALAVLTGLGIVSLVDTYGLIPTLKRLGVLAAILIPFLGAVIWWSMRRDRRERMEARRQAPENKR